MTIKVIVRDEVIRFSKLFSQFFEICGVLFTSFYNSREYKQAWFGAGNSKASADTIQSELTQKSMSLVV